MTPPAGIKEIPTNLSIAPVYPSGIVLIMETKTHSVLAGAYRGKGSDLKNLLTHSSTDGEHALCGKVKVGHLADEYADDSTARPTCERCLAKDTRFQK
jgi:hypothetical protein